MSTNNNNTSPSNGQHGPPANNAANSSKTPSSNLLLKLLEACARHKRRHEHERREPSSSSEEERVREQKCLGELNQFAAFLPRIEATVNVRESYLDEYHYNAPREGGEQEENDAMRGSYLDNRDQTKHLRADDDADDAGNLCALYRAIARGSFCPKAVRYLFSKQTSDNGESANATTGNDIEMKDIDLAKGILPRVLKLLQFLAWDPVRTALLPLKLPKNKKAKTMVNQLGRHAIRAYHQDEDIGSTIASLLALLQSDRLRLAAVQDLINLSNDLSTIDEARVLFHPPTPDTDNAPNDDQSKIRIRVFTELSLLFEVGQDSGVRAECGQLYVQIPSRRSLLALQCGVWVALQHLIPIISGSLALSSSLGKDKSLMVLESARRVLLSRSLLPESQCLGWRYSLFDLSIHSLLSLRMRLGIVGLLGSMTSSKNGVVQAVGSVVSLPTLELAVLVVEASKFQLSRNRTDCQEGHTHGKGNKDNSARPTSKGLESDLASLYSSALSNLLVSVVVLPDYAPSSQNEIWLHSFPHVIECIANMVDSSNAGDKSLGHVVMRIFHAILLRGGETSNLAVLHLFQNRCQVRGFFSRLFDLANDSLDAISVPTISILIHLLGAHSGTADTENNVENSCSNALASFENDDQMDIDTENETTSLRLGNKRRRLQSVDGDSEPPTSSDWSIQATFTQAIADALRSARTIETKLDSQKSRGSNIISLLSESDISLLRCVTSILRILCSLRSQCHIRGTFRYTDKVLASLSHCIERVCGALANSKCESGRMQYVETHLLPLALSLIVSVGLHVCQLPNQDEDVLNVSVRESMSHCALASVLLFDDEQTSQTGEKNKEGVCSECFSLGSIIEMADIPASSCLCRLDVDANTHPKFGNVFTLQSQ